MSLIVDDCGKNNRIIAPAAVLKSMQGRIKINGDLNIVTIDQGCFSSNFCIELGSNCEINVGSNCNLGNLFVYALGEAVVNIGQGSGFNGLVRVLLHEPGQISIGSGCLFGSDVDVTLSDMHSILDEESGQRINHARDVLIEDNVWIGQRAMLLKGSKVGAGSIIGAGAVVTGAIPKNVVAAGNPARIVRTGVRWKAELL